MTTKDRGSFRSEEVALYYCAGESCPGLPYKASDRAHPVSCAESKEKSTLQDWSDIIMNRPSEPLKLTDADRERMVNNMRKYGGSFVQALALAYIRADLDNRRRIEKAFPEIVEQYRKPVG